MCIRDSRVTVNIYCAKPGMVIGKGGEERVALENKLTKDVYKSQVDVVGVSKGKGYQGVIKRYGQHLSLIHIYTEKNEHPVGDVCDITAWGAKVRTLVIATDEELMIARDTKEVLEK